MIATFALLAVSLAASQRTPEDGWTALFNGRDLSGWQVKIAGHPLGENYKNTFRVEDGILKVVYDEYDTFDGEFGHLFYDEELSSYRLRVEYRFVGASAPGSPDWAFRNSGVMIHSQAAASMAVDQEFPVSIEVQFLGGDGRSERPTANLCTPGTHVVMDGELVTQHCVGSTAPTYHGDDWVSVEVLVRGGELIEHIVDGRTVIAYSHPTLGGEYKPEDYPLPDGTPLDRGYIALQSEGHPIEFRRVELKKLTSP